MGGRGKGGTGWENMKRNEKKEVAMDENDNEYWSGADGEGDVDDGNAIFF